MKKTHLALAAVALAAATSTQAALIPVDLAISGTSTGGGYASTGTGTGTYDSSTGEIFLNVSTTTDSNTADFTVESQVQYNGLTGQFQALACFDLGSSYDICGNDGGGNPYIELNSWTPVTVLSNTVNGTGNGEISTSYTNPYGLTVLSSLTLTASEVPVPAAAWLFGSALIGLAGLKRRK